MKGIYHFLKATILGGLFGLVPIVVLGVLVVWSIEIALEVVVPVFKWLPDKSVGGVSLTVLAAIASLIGICFLAGLTAEISIIRRVRDRAEQFALFVPGYALMKSVGASFVGMESKLPLKTVLVRLEASWQLGFLMETLVDGRHVVFIPGVPKALVGELHIVAADRVEVLAMSVSVALDVLSRMGVGLGQTWPKEIISA